MSGVEMRSSDLDLSEIREILVESLGDSVKWHSDFEDKPLELHLKNPLPVESQTVPGESGSFWTSRGV